MVKSSVIFNTVSKRDFERNTRYVENGLLEYDDILKCAKYVKKKGDYGAYVRYVSGIYLNEGDSIKFDFEAIAEDEDGVSVILDYSKTNKKATANPVFKFTKQTGEQFENVNGEFSVNNSGYYSINIGKFSNDGGTLYLRNVMVEIETIGSNTSVVDWIDLETTSDFEVYSDVYGFAYKRFGDLVTLQGAVKNTKRLQWTSDGNGPIVTMLPAEIRPNKRVVTLQQGSGKIMYALTMHPEGHMRITRYNMGEASAQASDMAIGAWLNINLTYAV